MFSLGFTKVTCLTALIISFTLSGCSISESIGSLSNSAGSLATSSGSISGSSKSSADDGKTSTQAEDSRYESEIQDFTVTYLRTNSSVTDQISFMKGISDIASQNGIVDWEANPKTYRGIGMGLKKAKISSIQYENYKKKFTNNHTGKMDSLQEGYESND